MPSATDNPVDKEEFVVVEIQSPAEIYSGTLSFDIAFLLKCIGYIVSLLERLGRLWMEYYPIIFGEIMLPSPLKFIVVGLAGFAEMKSQRSEFPFKTHPRSMNVAITCLLLYGLASAAQHFISVTRLGPSSIYSMVAHSGRIGSLCILVASVFRRIGQQNAEIDTSISTKAMTTWFMSILLQSVRTFY